MCHQLCLQEAVCLHMCVKSPFCVLGARLTISSDPDEDSGSEELSGRADVASAPQLSKVFEELLEVVTRAVEKLSIEWPDEKTQNKKRKLDECFLTSGLGHQPRKHLPFFPDLHIEVSRSWNNPYSARIHTPLTLLDYHGFWRVWLCSDAKV